MIKVRLLSPLMKKKNSLLLFSEMNFKTFAIVFITVIINYNYCAFYSDNPQAIRGKKNNAISKGVAQTIVKTMKALNCGLTIKSFLSSFYIFCINCIALLAISFLFPFSSKAISKSWSPPIALAETMVPIPKALCFTRSPTCTKTAG